MGAINVSIKEGIARIEIANPARYNAMSLAMWKEMAGALDAIERDSAVRVVLLRGAGDKAFVSGADISEFDDNRNDADRAIAYADAVFAAEHALIACSRPVVANIHGICMGGGMGLALACDLRYAALDARLRMPAARLGLGYGLPGMERFVAMLGAARTAELFYTARTFDGAEAQRIGFVHQAWKAAELDARVEEVLGIIAANAPLTIRAAKLAIGVASAGVTEGGRNAVADALRACSDSNDFIEGRKAFAAKRPPQFTGT